MHWLYLVIAVVLLAAAMKASGWLVIVLLLASVVGFIAWMLGWVSSRISSGARNDTQIISPEEMRRLREQAEARRASAQPGSPPPPGGEPPA